MAWRLEFTRSAERDLTRLPRGARDAVRSSLDRLLFEAGSADLKKLAGREGRWWLPAERWRTILRLDSETSLISVVRILPRGSAYRGD